MKTVGITILIIVWAVTAHAQLSLQIDSLDISNVQEMAIEPDYYFGHMDKASPRLKISATIKNNTNENVYIYYAARHRPKVQIKFLYRDVNYLKNAVFLLSSYCEILLTPDDSRRVTFWTLVPQNSGAQSNVERWKGYNEFYNELFELSPSDWNWGTENPSNADYLQWFKEILPKIKVIVSNDKGLFLESDPVDLQKIIVTSNLTDDKLN